MITILSSVALIFSLIGNILVNMKKKYGFIIWSISNIFWIIVNFVGQTNYPQVIMYIVYVALNVQGFILWNRKEK